MQNELMRTARLAVEEACRAGASDAVARVGEDGSTSFDFRNGKIEKVQHSASRGLGIELYVDGRHSSHSATDLRPAQVKRFIEDAVALTRFLEPDPFRVIPDPALYAGRSNAELDLVDVNIKNFSRERSLEWLKEMDAAIRVDARVVTATTSVSVGQHASARFSSNGFEGTTESTSISYGGDVTLSEPDGRRPEAYRMVRGRNLQGLPEPAVIGREALERALKRLGSVKAPSARGAMVLDAEPCANLISRLLGGLNAGAIQQKRSFLADKLNQKVASEVLTIIDEPFIKHGLGSRHYDGEGIAAKTLPLFERGVLRNYLVDTYYGKKLGWQATTGGMSNLKFELGSKNALQLASDAGDGFYVNGFLGGNCDGNTGDFSLGIRGHKIERGALGAPVSEMNITGNLLELFSNLVAVGNDPAPISSFYAPSMLFKDVQFSGS